MGPWNLRSSHPKSTPQTAETVQTAETPQTAAESSKPLEMQQRW